MRQYQRFWAIRFPLPLQSLAGVAVIVLTMLGFLAGIVLYLGYLLVSALHW